MSFIEAVGTQMSSDSPTSIDNKISLAEELPVIVKTDSRNDWDILSINIYCHIARIKGFLSKQATEKLVCGFIYNRLDYWNSVYVQAHPKSLKSGL